MAGQTHVYDIGSVVGVFNGIPLGGFGDDTAIEIEYNEDDFTLQMGVDGDGTRSKTNNGSATITITLMQTSETNDLLNAIRQLGINSPSGVLGIGPFMVKDLNGRELHSAEKAWIKRAPNAPFGKEAGPREWVLETASLKSNYGGN